MNPFEKYFAVKRGNAYYANKIFKPKLEFVEKDFCLSALTRSGEQVICSLKDVITLQGNLTEGTKNNFLGLLGERMLSVTLEKLIEEATDTVIAQEPKAKVSGGVIREKPSQEGKEYVATYNSHYLLKHKGRSNFVILKKDNSNSPRAWYQQEKSGLQASEIDGLAYLHHDDKMYLVIGESKMINNWWNMRFEEFYDTMKDRIIIPFKALFPNHELMFLFLGKEGVLYDTNSYANHNHGSEQRIRTEPVRLKQKSCQLAELLDSNNIKTIFAPLPETPRALEEYAQEMYDALPLAREMIKAIEKMI